MKSSVICILVVLVVGLTGKGVDITELSLFILICNETIRRVPQMFVSLLLFFGLEIWILNVSRITVAQLAISASLMKHSSYNGKGSFCMLVIVVL